MVAALVISTIMLTLVLTLIFSRIIIKQSNDISQQMLSKLAFTTENIYSESYSVLLSLGFGDNIDLNTMMFGDQRHRLRDYSGYTRMRLLQTIYPGIAYIAVYNSQLDALMCTVGLDQVTVDTVRSIVRSNYSGVEQNLHIPMTNNLIAAEGYPSENKTITLVYYSPLSSERSIGAILLAIDCSYLSQYMTTSDSIVPLQQSMLVDNNGLVLAHSDSSRILEDFSSLEYIDRVLQVDTRSGYFISSIDRKRTLVTYMKVDGFDGFLISLAPLSASLNQLILVVKITVLILLIVLVMGAIYSLYATKRTFNPIENLLVKVGYQPVARSRQPEAAANEIKYLDEQFSHYVTVSNINESLLLNYALEALIKGEPDDEQASLLRQNEEVIGAPYYMVCLVSFNRSSFYRDLSREKKYHMIHELANIIDEAMQPICLGNKTLLLSSNLAVAILRLESSSVPKGMVLALMEARKIFSKRYPQKFAAAVSSCYDDLYSLQDAYEEARQLLNERFFIGEEAVLLKQDRQISFINYNRKLENELWYAIQENDDAKIITSINLFISELRSLSYDYARLYISQLTINLLTLSLAGSESELKPAYFDIYRRSLDQLDTLSQCHVELLTMCRQLAYNQNQQKNAQHSDKIDKAMHMIKERYSDNSFSTKTAAQEVGLSIIYFNRLFKKEVGQSFSTCLNSYRLNMACSQLSTTDLAMSQICQNVGFINESYFYTLFKREYGITPQQFRKKQQEGS